MEHEPTISDEIISFLFSSRSMYRQKKILWERVRSRLKSSKQNYYQTIYRLSKNGYIKKEGEGYILSPKGESTYTDPHRLIYARPKKNKKILVMFDVPEKKKKTREWLRAQIRWWDFKMIQKSVWLGNGPLPPEFKKRLKDLSIEKSVLTFAIRKQK